MFGLFSAFGLLADRLDDDRAVLAGVRGDAAQRLFERAAQDVDAGLDVAFSLDCRRAPEMRVDQRDAAARDDAFLDRGAGGARGRPRRGASSLSARSRWPRRP